METVQFSKSEEYVQFKEEEIPKITGPTDVLVKMLFCGITKNDLRIIDGELFCKPEDFFIMGREMCGIVLEVGTDVVTLKTGDNVVINPNSYCEICNSCRTGNRHLCWHCRVNNIMGVFSNGGWAEYLVVSHLQVFSVSKDFPLELGVLTHTMANVMYAFDMIGNISFDAHILVMGVGITGCLCIALLHFKGYKNVVVVEPVLVRQEIIQHMEVPYRTFSPCVAIDRYQRNPKFSFDLIFDCTSSSKALEIALMLVNLGGKIYMLNNKSVKTKVTISPYELQSKDASVIGVSTSIFTYTKAIAALELLNRRYLDYNILGIKVYPLRHYKEALDHMRRESVIKAVFRMPDDCKG
ncbi:hypothetical protein FQA39_LY10141 [Lamprigera yunnana]|nr:hypothetical protein FQA39_LY10141 [Lamprigera yunnana]